MYHCHLSGPEVQWPRGTWGGPFWSNCLNLSCFKLKCKHLGALNIQFIRTRNILSLPLGDFSNQNHPQVDQSVAIFSYQHLQRDYLPPGRVQVRRTRPIGRITTCLPATIIPVLRNDDVNHEDRKLHRWCDVDGILSSGARNYFFEEWKFNLFAIRNGRWQLIYSDIYWVFQKNYMTTLIIMVNPLVWTCNVR